jgi:hypothetical protein
MALEPLSPEFADFCPVCEKLAALCWRDTDLDKSICDDCAGCLAKAEHTLSSSDLDHPSPELIKRNP